MIKEEFKKLECLRLNKRISVRQFVKELSISRGTYINWKTGKTIPSDINLHAIKKYIDKHQKTKGQSSN